MFPLSKDLTEDGVRIIRNVSK